MAKDRKHDPHTREGRKVIDGWVREALGEAPLYRGEIAKIARLPPLVVSASLKRGTRERWAMADGERSLTVYTAVAS